MKTTNARAVLAGILLATAGTNAAASGLRHGTTDDAAVVARGGATAIDVLANDPGVSAATELRIYRQPANGIAVVSGRQLVYTPDAGFTGRDTLVYSVKTGRSFGIATVTIDVVDGVTLSGRVTATGPASAAAARGRLRAGAGAGADVVVRVGGQVFQAQAGTDGRYEIPVAGNAGDMVRLESTSGGVVLASIAGSFGGLVAAAGSDGVLTRDEDNRVQLTPLSASMAYLMQLANGGEVPADDAGLAVAQGAIDTGVMLEMAAAVRLVADGAYALPAGVPDTMALISDTDAYRGFVDGVYADDPEALPGTIAATLSDPDVVPPAAEDDLVGAHTLLSSSAPGTVRVGLIEGARVELAADGTGRYVDIQRTADAGVAWEFVDGVAHVVLDEPQVTEYMTYRNGNTVQLVQTLYSLDFGVLVDGGASGRDLASMTTHAIWSYPDNPEYPDEVRDTSFARQSYRDGVAWIPFLAGEFPAVRALPVYRPEVYPDATGDSIAGHNYALYQFNAGGAGTLLDDGQAFTWSLDAAGRLHVAYDDGESGVFTRFVQDGRKGDGVLAEFGFPDGSAKLQYAMSSVRDGSLAFDAETLTQPWRSGFDVSQTAYDFAGFDGFYIVLEAGGTGYQVNVSAEYGSSSAPLAWSIEDGAMVARRYWSPSSGVVAECPAGDSGCYLLQARRWVPVSRDGNRIYVHEELWTDQDGAGPESVLALQSQRANFYDIEAPPL